MKKFLIALILFAGLAQATAKNQEDLEGRVLDGKKGVANITVKVSGTDKITKTNRRGYFKIEKVSVNTDTLLIGMSLEETLDIPLEGTNKITIDTVYIKRDKKENIRSAYGGTVYTRTMLEQSGELDLL